MTVDSARAAVITGDGVVARYPGLLCVARCGDRDVLLRLLDVCAGAAGPDPGRALARRLAQWMGGPDAPGDDLEFGTVATAGAQLGVFLVGAVEVAVPGSPVALSGSDAATWTDRLISLPGAPVLLALDGARPPAGLAEGVNDLRAGVVPGAGAVLFPAGRAAAAHPGPGAGSALDGPTIRTPAHSGATRPAAAPDPAAPDPAPAGSVHIGAGSNGVVRNGTPWNGSPSGTGTRRARSGDAGAPNGYEWFADWSDGGGPPGDGTGPGPAAPGAGRWPWSEPPADRARPRPDDRLDAAGEALSARPEDRRRDPGRAEDGPPDRTDAPWLGRTVDGRPDAAWGDVPEGAADGPADEGRPDPADGRWAEPPTPAGGSTRTAPSDERTRVWADPADPFQEGRHAVAGSGEQGAHPVPGDTGHHDAVPAAGTAGFADADDATPVTAVAAVEPLEQAVAEVPAEPRPGPEERPGEVDGRGPDDGPGEHGVPGAGVSVEGLPDGGLPADTATDGRGPAAEAAPPAARTPTPTPRPHDPATEVPAPAEVPAPTPADPSAGPDEPLLHGLLCEDGHLNDPRASSCVACGAPVEPGEDVVGPRPPLGRIVFDDGATFTVDAEYLVGRMPEADPRTRSGELQPIVVEDRSGSVSRVHAEILINGWDVVLVDSGSRNGTFVAGPDDSGWTPLAPGRTSLLLPGTRVRMGGRTFVFEPPVPVG